MADSDGEPHAWNPSLGHAVMSHDSNGIFHAEPESLESGKFCNFNIYGFSAPFG
jgi:hypothetical protein